MFTKIKNIFKRFVFLKKIKNDITKFCRRLLAPIRRIGLKNRDFTLISNNCWAGFVYQYFNLPYNTPFIGLFIPAPSYIKLLSDFDAALGAELSFIKKEDSAYYSKISGINGRIYPIGVLPGGIEIHFLHYKTELEANEKWNKRKKRINKSNMLVKMSEIDCCSKDIIEQFDKLPFKNKICYTAGVYPNIKSSVQPPSGFVLEGEVRNEWKYKPYKLKSILNKLITYR